LDLEPLLNIEPRHILILLVVILVGALVLALILIGLIVWRVRKIKLPPDADPFTALLLTPLSVVIVLDLLDLSLDFLSAPIAWTLMTYLGLLPLRGAAAVVGLIPGTQFLPTMTIAWFVARLLKLRRY
jgi:amino acid transporter